MRKTLAIKVENLSKEYTLGGEVGYQQTFREMISEIFKHPFNRLKRIQGRSGEQERFWALQNVSFEVEEGDVVGIIGANGAGKSTLLKILSRITAPTKGLIEYRGRIASLLEVGTGFHPELTGRENIFINGAILGMTKSDIQKRFDEIVIFADIEQFLDTPVKRYSSGMYVRLAFAVAAHMEPDVLIVDEVLAVGDSEFQKKCIGKMKDVAGHGRTVLFVSHNMGIISDLCSNCILIDKGKIIKSGDPTDVIKHYFKNITDISKWAFKGELAKDIQVSKIIINDNADEKSGQVSPSDDIMIKVEGICRENLSDVKIAITISAHGIRILTLWDSDEFCPLPAGDFKSVFTIPKYSLRPGEYTIGVGGDRERSKYWFFGDNLVQLKIVEEWDDDCKKDRRGVLNFRAGKVMSSRIVPVRRDH